MAADDKLDNDATTIAEDETQGKVTKKRSPVVIYAVIALAMVVAGYFIGNMLSKSPKDTPAESKSQEAEDDNSHDPDRPSEVFLMEDIIVNPSGTGGTRFLSVSVGFEVGSSETVHLFEKREAVIKDALITILGSKSIEQLSDPKEKEITRFQIRKRTEQLLGIDDLAAVYFTDFVLQ
jgi:flagellar FliL protein